MGKINRFTYTPFGGSLTAAALGSEIFGSSAAGPASYSIDPVDIQSLPAWVNGWNAAVAAGKTPYLEDMNALEFVHGQALAYLFQQGIPEWDSGTNYFIDSFVQVSGTIYKSLIDNNLNNAPSLSSSDWQAYSANSFNTENAFRNAGFGVNQRGTSGSVGSGTTAYTSDGWMVGATGAAAAWVVANGAIGFTSAVGLTDVKIKQRIESTVMQSLFANNLEVIANPVVTVQFTINNETDSSFTPTLTVKAPTGGDAWGGALQTLVNAQVLQACPAGQITTVAFTFTMNRNYYGFGLEVTLDLGAALNNGLSNTINVYQPAICGTPFANTGLNSSPPVPQIRPQGVELGWCQRYFYQLGPIGSGTMMFCSGYELSATTAYFQVPFPVPMRVTPTITIVNKTHFSVLDASATTALTDLASSTYLSPTSFNLLATVAAGLTAHHPANLVDAGSTDAALQFSAEL